jgi:hypothetical protein
VKTLKAGPKRARDVILERKAIFLRPRLQRQNHTRQPHAFNTTVEQRVFACTYARIHHLDQAAKEKEKEKEKAQRKAG